MKTIRERRYDLADLRMQQSAALPRYGFTYMQMALYDAARILASDDPEGDEYLAEYEASLPSTAEH